MQEIAAMIIYEDPQLFVCHKPPGLAVQNARVGTMDLESGLKNLLARRNPGRPPYLAVIHRLDQPVEGLVMFAKTREAARRLNAQLTAGTIEKYYLALVQGELEPREGELADYLVKDGRANTSRRGRKGEPGAKEARLAYSTLETGKGQSLLEIRLYTGRHHQIRVQLALAGHPLVGDRKYGAAGAQEGGGHPSLGREKGSPQPPASIALCAYRLRFFHPRTGELLEFQIEPKGGFHRLSH